MLDSPRTGVFICFEGIDGSGKTSHSRFVVDYLKSNGYNAVYTTEPTRYSIPGRKLRESFFAPERLPVKEEFKLFLEDRIIHLKDEVIPQLNDGKIVVTDRYYFSSVAYQGSRGLDWHYILEENEKVSIVPDIVLLLDLPVDAAISRIANDRVEGVNIFELKAKNKDNQITVKQIKIEYIITPPELNIAYEKETDKNIQLITGNANDKNDISPKVFCNNEEVPTSKGSFNKILPLKEGINTFTFEAINSNNKKTTKTIEITYTPKPEYQLIYKGGQVTGYTGNPKNVVIPMSNNDIEITSIGAMAFQNCETLESISMPDTVIEMGSLVFQHCKNLKKVKLSNNIKVIPPQTFAYCENLQEINLGNAKTIKSEAFRGCINLNTITIPNTVALIEAHTFRECYRLTDVIFESDQAPKMGLYVFSYVEPMPTIHHPENSISYNTEWYNSFTN